MSLNLHAPVPSLVICSAPPDLRTAAIAAFYYLMPSSMCYQCIFTSKHGNEIAMTILVVLYRNRRLERMAEHFYVQ